MVCPVALSVSSRYRARRKPRSIHRCYDLARRESRSSKGCRRLPSPAISVHESLLPGSNQRNDDGFAVPECSFASSMTLGT